jgi:hypothetical protein
MNPEISSLLNAAVTQIPMSLVLAYFFNQFLKRLERNIEKTDELHDRLLIIETSLKLPRFRRRHQDDDEDDD